MNMTRTPALMRRRLLASIHAGAKQLGLEDDAYRDLVERVSRELGPAQRSAGACDQRQLDAIVSELRRLGGIQPRTWPDKPKTLSPLLRKTEALLADAGRPWSYAHAMAQHMYRVDRLEFLSQAQLHRLVAALQIDANRRT
jgi:phage gp16-like protein